MSFIYLATPYSKYKAGLESANAMASRYAGLFIGKGLPIFCPIAHSHSISVHGGLKAKDHSIWMPLDTAFMDSAFALIVTLEDGWQESYGVQQEIKYFLTHEKPIYHWHPPTITKELFKCLQMDWAKNQLAQRANLGMKLA